MKKTMVYWPQVLAAAALLLAGCAEQEKAYRIVVIPKGLTHEHWQSVLRGARRAEQELTERGLPTVVIWDGPLRERDALAQIQIVDRRVSTQVDGIVLAPQHSQTMVPPVDRAGRQGIPTAVIDSGLESPEMYVKYIATNNYNGGWLAAEHLLKVLAAEGKTAPRIVLFRYQVGSESTDQREQGFIDYVEKANAEREQKGEPPIVWLSKDKYAGATKDSALREAGPLVNRLRDQIDGIFAVNESSAMGMLQALRNLGLAKKVRLMGFDSSEPLLQAVRDGEVDGLILQDPYMMGFRSVWDLVHHLAGYDVNEGGKKKVFGTGEFVVTIQNLDDPRTVELFDPKAQGERQIAVPEYERRGK